MSFTPLDSALYGPTFTTPEMTELFSDAAHLRRMVRVEVALAKVQAELGLIPAVAAHDIAAAAPRLQPDYSKLQEGIQSDGVPVVPLLAELRDVKICQIIGDLFRRAAFHFDVVF